jgi:ADP-ribosylglycohydrolase
MTTLRNELPDYAERVYAGCVGKVIGVFLGQPIEGWSNERIERELGEVNGFVSERLGKPIVVSDDDIAGTFVFIRALRDHAAGRAITSEQIGRTWLNYLIEYENTLAWFGLGRGSEHTAFLRLQAGIPAPRSGSMELNGQWLAEQIGGQIFIDGWGMVAPGDPDLAVELAGRAARVSHDGAAVHAAQAVAAMEALAFVEQDMTKLLDCALARLPPDSPIRTVHVDVRAWAAAHGSDWRKTLACIMKKYGGSRAGVVPEHAIMVMAWAHAPDSFSRAMTICAMAGSDTDCNLGNVGCLMGIKQGTGGFIAADGRDWREAFADRMLVPTWMGTTDCLREADEITRSGRVVMGWQPQAHPKSGARFHFSMPGSQHGFLPCDTRNTEVRNVVLPSGGRALRIAYRDVSPSAPAAAGTPAFLMPDRLPVLRDCYGGAKVSILCSGQKLEAALVADPANTRPVQVALRIRSYTDLREASTAVAAAESEPLTLAPGAAGRIAWQVPDTAGLPIYELAVVVKDGGSGAVLLDWLNWGGSPRVRYPESLFRPGHGYPYGWMLSGKPRLHLVPSERGTMLHACTGTALLATGFATPDWRDYTVSADVTLQMADAAGLVARYRGLRRYLSLEFDWRAKRLSLVRHFDGARELLASAPCAWEIGERHNLRLEVRGDSAVGYADRQELARATFRDLPAGGVGLRTELGACDFGAVSVEPA